MNRTQVLNKQVRYRGSSLYEDHHETQSLLTLNIPLCLLQGITESHLHVPHYGSRVQLYVAAVTVTHRYRKRCLNAFTPPLPAIHELTHCRMPNAEKVNKQRCLCRRHRRSHARQMLVQQKRQQQQQTVTVLFVCILHKLSFVTS